MSDQEDTRAALVEKHGPDFEKALVELEGKHGAENVRAVDTILGPVVLRNATRPEYKMFRSTFWKEAQRADALETLVRRTLVYPSPQAFDGMLDKRPAIADRLGNVALELAGLVGEETGKG